MFRHLTIDPLARVLVTIATTLLFAACESDGDADMGSTNDAGDARAGDVALGPDAVCAWGASQACVCTSGGPGTQRCLSDGTFGPCVCGPSTDAGTADTSIADTADAAGTPDVIRPDGPDAASPLDAVTDLPRDTPADAPRDAATSDLTPAPGDASAGTLTTRSLTLAVRHLVADRTRKLLYATVAGTAPMHANSLVVIDPADLSVKHAVALGSEPSFMAISDSAATLWVGIDGAFAVRKLDLRTSPPTAGTQFALPKGQFNDIAAAGPMAVLPGSETSLAVSLHRFGVSPSFAGAAVLDDGVARTMKTNGHTGASRLVAGAAGWLFGYNNLHTGFGFYAIPITATGLTQTEHDGLVNGFDTDIVYAANRVYATSGEIVDVSNPAAPVRAGKFGFAGALAPRPSANRVFMISASDGITRTDARLRVLDPNTFTQISSAIIGGLAQDRVFDLVDLGGDTLAFLSGGDRFATIPTVKIHVLSNPLVGSPP
jgi:hypothetical protein